MSITPHWLKNVFVRITPYPWSCMMSGWLIVCSLSLSLFLALFLSVCLLLHPALLFTLVGDWWEYIRETMPALKVFHCAEVLYQPSLVDKEACGIHDTSFQNIMKCGVNIRKESHASVVLSSSTTCSKRFLWTGRRNWRRWPHPRWSSKCLLHQSESTRYGLLNFQQMKIKVVARIRYGLEDQSCLPSQMSSRPLWLPMWPVSQCSHSASMTSPCTSYALIQKNALFFDRGNFRQGEHLRACRRKHLSCRCRTLPLREGIVPAGFIGKEASGTRVCLSRCRCGRESAQMFCAHICRTSRWLSGFRVH